MKIAILTSANQWFVKYAKILHNKIDKSDLLFDHNNIKKIYDIVFILSYHNIIPMDTLKQNRHNIVIHASPLPKGKGWSPMFWQILEDKKQIPFTMFEASSGVDDGDIYMQKVLELTGYELNAELREKQANFTMDMCLEFIDNYDKYKTAKKQSTQETFYKKRDKQASELDIDKTIKEQFNLLRIVDNENYPAFFQLDGNRYILKIELEKWGGAELIDFTDMTLEEKKMVLEWRNDIGIKKWMYNTDDIKLQNHFDYIESLAGLHNKQYLLVKKDNNYIGVICFTKINYMDKVTEFGLYANPFKKMLGVGRILEELSIKYIFDILKLNRIKLEVFSNNLKTINLHKKYNFHEVMSKTINNKSVICMELDKCD